MTGAGVSVIVPCFDAARTLAETLESAIGQEGVAEIIVIDDGSRDDTLAIARRFEPAVKLLTGPNRGVSAARNRGIASSTAPWLLFLDSDDLLVAGSVRQRLAKAESTNADVIVCDWEELNDHGGGSIERGPHRCVDWQALTEDAELATATAVWATTAALLYRREIVERIGGFRTELPVIQDARFLFDAARAGARFAHAAHVGARYRVLAHSLSRRDPAQFWRDVLVNGRQIEQHWRDGGTLSGARLTALGDIYNQAVRGLFASSDGAYFEAVACQKRLGLPLPRHSRITPPLARMIGLRATRSLLGIVNAS